MRGTVALAEATVSTSDRKPFSFFVASPDVIVNIWPTSKEERDEWMVAIKNVVRQPFAGVDIDKAQAGIRKRKEDNVIDML